MKKNNKRGYTSFSNFKEKLARGEYSSARAAKIAASRLAEQDIPEARKLVYAHFAPQPQHPPTQAPKKFENPELEKTWQKLSSGRIGASEALLRAYTLGTEGVLDGLQECIGKALKDAQQEHADVRGVLASLGQQEKVVAMKVQATRISVDALARVRHEFYCTKEKGGG